MKKFRNIIVIIAVCILAAVGLSLKEIPKNSQVKTPESERLLEYSIENFTLTTLDDDGKPNYNLVADSMIHYTNDPYSTIIKPRLVYYGNNENSWKLESEKGNIYIDNKKVDLIGEVLINRKGSDTVKPLSVTTSNLKIFPDKGYAVTADPANIHNNFFKLSGVGMRAYLNDNRLRLLSRVRGKYEISK